MSYLGHISLPGGTNPLDLTDSHALEGKADERGYDAAS